MTSVLETLPLDVFARLLLDAKIVNVGILRVNRLMNQRIFLLAQVRDFYRDLFDGVFPRITGCPRDMVPPNAPLAYVALLDCPPPLGGPVVADNWFWRAYLLRLIQAVATLGLSRQPVPPLTWWTPGRAVPWSALAEDCTLVGPRSRIIGSESISFPYAVRVDREMNQRGADQVVRTYTTRGGGAFLKIICTRDHHFQYTVVMQQFMNTMMIDLFNFGGRYSQPRWLALAGALPFPDLQPSNKRKGS